MLFVDHTLSNMRTFKYHMTLREGEGDLLKPSEYRYMRGQIVI